LAAVHGYCDRCEAWAQRGLCAGIVGGFLISLLGGSRFQIGGPAGAFIVLVAAIVEREGYDGLVLATLFAGLILIAVGLLWLGTFIKYIPYPVTVGFTAGIAVIIVASQVLRIAWARCAERAGRFPTQGDGDMGVARDRQRADDCGRRGLHGDDRRCPSLAAGVASFSHRRGRGGHHRRCFRPRRYHARLLLRRRARRASARSKSSRGPALGQTRSSDNLHRMSALALPSGHGRISLCCRRSAKNRS